MNKRVIKKIWRDWEDSKNFSGVFSMSDETGAVILKYNGFRNKSENLLINEETAFGIASGTKFFTGLAICKLVDKKLLHFEDLLWDILPYPLEKISKKVTIYHLLTHTSGVGDYIDEDAENDIEQLDALYKKYPVYLWENLEYYLQMITTLKPKFDPGERFSYSNSGYVLLGLVVEAVTGISFQEYVTDSIIKTCKLKHTGFYRNDSLPFNTAYGYLFDEETSCWRTNVFSLPVIGGSDGGLYSCAADIDKLWRMVVGGKVLSRDMTALVFNSYVVREQKDASKAYGLGVYINDYEKNKIYYIVGGDFGVDFFSVYYPHKKIVVTAFSNTGSDIWKLLEDIDSTLEKL